MAKLWLYNLEKNINFIPSLQVYLHFWFQGQDLWRPWILCSLPVSSRIRVSELGWWLWVCRKLDSQWYQFFHYIFTKLYKLTEVTEWNNYYIQKSGMFCTIFFFKVMLYQYENICFLYVRFDMYLWSNKQGMLLLYRLEGLCSMQQMQMPVFG